MSPAYDLPKSRAQCAGCGGDIHNYPISMSSREKGVDEWAHFHPEDWQNNVHQARPVAGTVQLLRAK